MGLRLKAILPMVGWSLIVGTALLLALLASALTTRAQTPVDSVADLIDAIEEANDSGDASIITLEEDSVFELTDVNNHPSGVLYKGPNGLPAITGNITIEGNGATIRRSDAPQTPDFRIFQVEIGAALHLHDLTIEGGVVNGDNDGGGIDNYATLTLTDSIVRDNEAGGDGGGIYNGAFGSVELVNSTISRNTAGNYGGGIFNGGSGSVELVNSTISGNEGDGRGGGLYNLGTLTVTGSTVSTNEASNGAGIYNISNGRLTLIESDVVDNTASAQGGGIGNFSSAGGSPVATLTNSTIRENTADHGGGIYNQSTLTLIESTVNHNTAIDWSGGGIFTTGNDGMLILSNSDVIDNSANYFGGGIQSGSGTTILTSSTVSGNTSNNDGGGISGTGAITVTNSLVSGNTAENNGGGFRVSGSLTLTNSTVSGNEAGEAGGIWSGSISTVDLTNSIVWGNAPSDLVNDQTPTVNHAIIGNECPDGAIECSSDDPRFDNWIDPAGPGWEPTSEGDYNLMPGSPAIDVGDVDLYNDSIDDLPQSIQDEIDPDQDLSGDPRVVGASIDLGAYEAQFTEPALSLTVLNSPVDVGQIVHLSVSITDPAASPEFSQGWRVTVTGYGSARTVIIDADGTGSLFMPANLAGTFTLLAETGELSDTATLIVNPVPVPPTVEDPEPRDPRLRNVPSHITLDAESPDGATLEYELPTAVDLDGTTPLEVVCEPAPGTFVPIGHTTVNCSATNSDDFTMSVSFGVTVRPFEEPDDQDDPDEPSEPGEPGEPGDPDEPDLPDFSPLDNIENPSFWQTWARTDLPVRDGQTVRTWMWGPGPFTESMWEAYAESPDGEREVIYFDKARMEITHPDADSDDLWYVTNGLLVVEMITGNRQVGDDTFEYSGPADVNVAGDPDDPNSPTYASLQHVLDAPAQDVGTLLTEQIDRDGNVSTDETWGDYGVTVGHVDEVTQHGIATPFWAFMLSQGLVYEDGSLNEDALFENPFYATGRPITEAYWANVMVAGEPRDVLIQCFERRCLTFTPGNDEGFVVEAGNVGQHYYSWRYVQAP